MWVAHYAVAAGVAGAIAAAAVCDAVSYRIPNRVLIVLSGLFAVEALARGGPFGWVLEHLLAAAALFVLGGLLYFVRLLGGGDAKFLAAAALWSGWWDLPRLLLVTALAGGALSSLLLVGRRLARRRAAVGALPKLFTDGAPVPYGMAIALGAADVWVRRLLLPLMGGA